MVLNIYSQLSSRTSEIVLSSEPLIENQRIYEINLKEVDKDECEMVLEKSLENIMGSKGNKLMDHWTN